MAPDEKRAGWGGVGVPEMAGTTEESGRGREDGAKDEPCLGRLFNEKFSIIVWKKGSIAGIASGRLRPASRDSLL